MNVRFARRRRVPEWVLPTTGLFLTLLAIGFAGWAWGHLLVKFCEP